MYANAGELLKTMKVRLEMQTEGIANPSKSVKAATRSLVEKLSDIDPQEDVEVTWSNLVLAKYVRVSTGEVLAEINEQDT